MASKYNSYADRLNKAFQTASIKTREAVDEYEKAKKNRSIKYQGEADYQRASDNLKKINREVWPEFQKTRDRLGRELQKEYEADRVLNPDSVDQNAITLIKSGLAKVGDLESMAAKYAEADNVTMLRYIGQTAREMAAKEQDVNARQRLNLLSYNVKADPAIFHKWNDLRIASAHYSGEYDRYTSPETIVKLSDHWSDDNVQTAIKDF